MLEVLGALSSAGIRAWLMGGWAIDALVGRQRRPHDDLDLLVGETDLLRAADVLAAAGFTGDVGIEGSSYLVDPLGRQVDIHAVRFRGDGTGVYLMDDGTPWLYEAAALDGKGTILNRAVACLTPEMMMVEHATGYELDAVHRADVEALAKAFGLPVPPAAWGRPAG